MEGAIRAISIAITSLFLALFMFLLKFFSLLSLAEELLKIENQLAVMWSESDQSWLINLSYFVWVPTSLPPEGVRALHEPFPSDCPMNDSHGLKERAKMMKRSKGKLQRSRWRDCRQDWVCFMRMRILSYTDRLKGRRKVPPTFSPFRANNGAEKMSKQKPGELFPNPPEGKVCQGVAESAHLAIDSQERKKNSIGLVDYP